MLGGLASFAFYAAGVAQDSQLLKALAYFGFLLNLINLAPVGILDGGAVWRSAAWLRRGGGRSKAYIAYALYFGTAAALVLGMYMSYVQQHRL
jgi:Zn-dependent protease